MPKSKKNQNQIEKKLEKLQELASEIAEASIIQPENPETWDSDFLYNLAANLKKALQILEDKKHPKEKDPWGEPLILEEGLCTLVDEYQNEEEDYE